MSSIVGASADRDAIRLTVGWDGPDAREFLPDEITTGPVPGIEEATNVDEAAVFTLRAVLASDQDISAVVVVCNDDAQRRNLEHALARRELTGTRLVDMVDALLEYLRVTGWLGSVDSFVAVHAGYSSAWAGVVDARTGKRLSSNSLLGGAFRSLDTDAGEALGTAIRDVIARGGTQPAALVLFGEGADHPGLHAALEYAQPLSVMMPPQPELVLARGAALIGIEADPAGVDVPAAPDAGSAPAAPIAAAEPTVAYQEPRQQVPQQSSPAAETVVMAASTGAAAPWLSGGDQPHPGPSVGPARSAQWNETQPTGTGGEVSATPTKTKRTGPRFGVATLAAAGVLAAGAVAAILLFSGVVGGHDSDTSRPADHEAAQPTATVPTAVPTTVVPSPSPLPKPKPQPKPSPKPAPTAANVQSQSSDDGGGGGDYEAPKPAPRRPAPRRAPQTQNYEPIPGVVLPSPPRINLPPVHIPPLQLPH